MKNKRLYHSIQVGKQQEVSESLHLITILHIIMNSPEDINRHNNMIYINIDSLYVELTVKKPQS